MKKRILLLSTLLLLSCSGASTSSSSNAVSSSSSNSNESSSTVVESISSSEMSSSSSGESSSPVVATTTLSVDLANEYKAIDLANNEAAATAIQSKFGTSLMSMTSEAVYADEGGIRLSSKSTDGKWTLAFNKKVYAVKVVSNVHNACYDSNSDGIKENHYDSAYLTCNGDKVMDLGDEVSQYATETMPNIEVSLSYPEGVDSLEFASVVSRRPVILSLDITIAE